MLKSPLFLIGFLLVPGATNGFSAPATPPPERPPEVVTIPAGCFPMGAPDNFADERPRHRVCLAAFRMQSREVTVADFGKCVAARRCTPPVRYQAASPTRRLCNGQRPGRADHPVNCVTWPQAQAYCAWRGRRLPTEAEWERAAQGPRGAAHPWGRAPATCAKAVVAERRGARLLPGCGTGGTLPGGSRPADRSPAGLWDLTGNVSEWTADWYALGYYKHSPETQPPGPRRGRARVVRGGSFRTPEGARLLRSTARQFSGSWDPSLGFRCAADAPRSPRRRR